jgi:hypothetical protein
MIGLLMVLVCALSGQTPDGAISGTVRSIATRLPVESAQVTLAGPAEDSAETDARGAFHFTGLAAGTYTVHVEKAGFTGPEPSKVEVRTGLAASVTIDLYPLARVEGRVVDEDGKPAAGVTVEATLAPYRKGIPYLRGRASDEDGRFEIVNLYPTDYLLRVSIPSALRVAGYPAIEYYPGVAEASQATPIHVAEGAQMAAFPIKLRRLPLVTFKGRIVDVSKDSPVVEVALDCEPGPIEGSYARHAVDAEGRFRIEGVPPGRHALFVYRGADFQNLPYTTTVDAGEEEAKVPVPGFANLQGLVKSVPAGPWEGVVGIGIGGGGHNVAAAEDGTFHLLHVPPGEWKLRMQANGLQQHGRTLRLAAVAFGAADALDRPIVVTEGGNPPITVTLSGESGRIAGTVESTEESVVFAERLPGGFGDRVQTASTGAGGGFLFSDLLPGEYRLAAWSLTPARQGVVGTDCGGRIVKVTVSDGQTATVKLKPCGQ